MDYLTRPIFPFDVDWSNRPAKSFAFDLRKLAVGFGAEYFATLQEHVVQGYKLDVTLTTAADLQAFDEFFDALTGRLAGFWLPAPFEAVQIVTADDATHFYIRDQNLRWTLGDHPDVYILLQRAGAVRAAKISAVVAASGGRERITLSGALATPATPADVVSRLHYVRLAGDVEDGEFLKEGGCASLRLNVIELPHEYEAFETGEAPIYLYHFSAGVPMDRHWRYTSFAAGIVSNNELFTAYPINHGALKKSGRVEAETLRLSGKYDAAHPLALFVPLPFARPLELEILQGTLADPDAAAVIFTGTVRRVADSGDALTADVDSWANILSRKIPPMLLQKEDNYQIFDDLTGNVPRWFFEITGTVTACDAAARPPTLTVTFNNDTSSQYTNWITADWFAGGWIEAGFGTAFSVRSVLSSTAAGGADPQPLVLELSEPLDVAVGSEVQLIPGYDGSAAQRRTKFRDFDNFGGFIAMPEKNPTLKTQGSLVSQGGKK